MSDKKMQKIKLLKILEILYRKTDADTPITTNQLISELSEMGINADRRTLYSDIEALRESGYEVEKQKRHRDMVYWVPKRSFDIPELKIIMDCIHSSRFVPEGKTNELIDKIAALGGSGRGELLKRNAVCFNAVKHSNESIYNIVEVLERSIERGKKVSFCYFDIDSDGCRKFRHEGSEYTEEPLAMICDDGNYYLLCYRSEEEYENNMKTFRIDKIDSPRMLEDTISPLAEESRDIAARYPLQAFRMYGGPLRDVTLLFNKSLLSVVYDKFGENTKIVQMGDKLQATVTAQISSTFWGWMMQFPSDMRIVSPEDLRDAYKEWVLRAVKEEF